MIEVTKEELDKFTDRLKNINNYRAELKLNKQNVLFLENTLAIGIEEVIDEMLGIIKSDLTADKFKYVVKEANMTKEIKINIVKDYINKINANILKIEYEVNRMNMAIESLNDEEKMIVKTKYIEQKVWDQVANSFNTQCRFLENRNVETKRLMNRAKEIKVKLYNIYYSNCLKINN